MSKPSTTPRLYTELADWWPLLSAPADYAEEAAFYRQLLVAHSAHPVRTLLELGSGGGNNASHLKQHFQLTLVDRSPGMLAVSQALNPECRHLQGDMRTVRLGHQFDAVFIHDAITYLTSEEDLAATFETAFAHCRPGGAALFAPDHVRETFRSYTDHGGHDSDSPGQGRALRYLEWTFDPDPADSTVECHFAYLLREPDGAVRCQQDLHVFGLFSRHDWLRLIEHAGFQPHVVPFQHSEVEGGPVDVFLGVRPLT